MVKKLFKHEYFALWRLMIPIWCVLFGVSVFGRLIQLFEQDNVAYDIINGSSIVFYCVVVLAVLACPVVLAVIRFYRNLFTGEGYLMFTLPVTPAQHIWVKLIVAVTTQIVNIFALIVSVAVFTFGDMAVEIGKAAWYLLKMLADVCDGQLPILSIEAVNVLVLLLASNLLLYYGCICIGQMAHKARILAAVGAYFGFYVIAQALETLLLIVFAFIDMEKVTLWMTEHMIATAHIGMWYYTLQSLVLSGIFFFICHYLMKRRLNLE